MDFLLNHTAIIKAEVAEGRNASTDLSIKAAGGRNASTDVVKD